MTLLSPGTHTFHNTIIIVEPDCTYLYCVQCGGLKMAHLLAAENPGQTVQITALWPACMCGSNESVKEAVQRALKSVDDALERFPNVGYIREVIRRIASREEMKG